MCVCYIIVHNTCACACAEGNGFDLLRSWSTRRIRTLETNLCSSFYKAQFWLAYCLYLLLLKTIYAKFEFTTLNFDPPIMKNLTDPRQLCLQERFLHLPFQETSYVIICLSFCSVFWMPASSAFFKVYSYPRES